MARHTAVSEADELVYNLREQLQRCYTLPDSEKI